MIYRLKSWGRERKLDRLPLGKTVRRGGRLKIEKIPWDIHWQTDCYLAMIIRDYLLKFTELTPAIGNIPETYGLEHDEAYAIWTEKVRSVAREFDNILVLGERIGIYDDIGEDLTPEQSADLFEEKHAATIRAFDALKEIFDELSW